MANSWHDNAEPALAGAPKTPGPTTRRPEAAAKTATSSSLAACLAVAAVLAVASAAVTGRVPTPGAAIVGAVRSLISAAGPATATSQGGNDTQSAVMNRNNDSYTKSDPSGGSVEVPSSPMRQSNDVGLQSPPSAPAPRRLATSPDAPPSGFTVSCSSSKSVTLSSSTEYLIGCSNSGASDMVVSVAIDNPSSCFISVSQCAGDDLKTCASLSASGSSTSTYSSPIKLTNLPCSSSYGFCGFSVLGPCSSATISFQAAKALDGGSIFGIVVDAVYGTTSDA